MIDRPSPSPCPRRRWLSGWRSLPHIAGLGLIALALVFALPVTAGAHPGSTPSEPSEPSVIRAEDIPRYSSSVTEVSPSVPGLEVRVVGTQDKLEATWVGREPLVIEGVAGEPMIRMSAAGVEVNARSPYVYKTTERFGRVDPPDGVDAEGPPLWDPIAAPGPISWYEHRAQWMSGERPAVVGDGTAPVVIREWEVAARLGVRDLTIRGVLEWVPDPGAVRDKASEVSSPLLSALVLTGALALGAAIGVAVRRRLEDAAT